MTSQRPIRRLESDREDLMREATALQQRAEFQVPGETETVIAGYRSDGSLSVYFGPDPCFHFNPDRKLRRAYVGGNLYRTQGETLARLHRVRTDDSVELQRHDLSPTEKDEFLAAARERLIVFVYALVSREAKCLRNVSGNVPMADKLRQDLTGIVAVPLRLAPRIPGKK